MASQTDNSTSTKIALPGFGLPLNHYSVVNVSNSKDSPFPSAINPLDIENGRTILELTSLDALNTLRIINEITDKPNWQVKVFSDEIVNKWKKEVLANSKKGATPEMMEDIIQEARHKATGYNAAVAELENIPEHLKDWHPGSDGKVLDLVHPSLFPLVYGRTRVLETGVTSLQDCIAKCGQGVIAPIPSDGETRSSTKSLGRRMVENPYSKKFQWLPCEVDISGDHSKITSYINNLHPIKHKALYTIIESVIDAAIPLWDKTLTGLRRCIVNEDDELIALKKRYAKKGLQVIVKLANIELTPENPTYDGGSWHIEGQLNEHICATALYYYSNENIKGSWLMFRQQSNTEVDDFYEQDDHRFLTETYGVYNHEPGVQVVGSVNTREGRLLTFPNILQHRVQPFQLQDPTKPVHRKILALFLVDPHLRVISTANVPCQQKDWWRENIATLDTGLDKLPFELKDQVFGAVTDDFPIGLDEAKELRLELMEERKNFKVEHDGAFTAMEFSLCEH